MARGDWHPDTRIRHRIVNIQLANDGEIRHIGVGFDIVSPNGRTVAESGWTWEIPTEDRRSLESVLRHMNDALVEHEGVAGIDFERRPAPPPPPI